MKIYAAIIIAASILPASLYAHTEGGHSQQINQGAVMKHDKKMPHEEVFLVKKGLRDGYVVTFHVMRAPEAMRHGTEQYHLMLTVEKNDQQLTDLVIDAKVTHPDGREKEARLVRMGSWYMARFNLSHEQGRHWLNITFQAAGNTYSTGIYYPETDYSKPSSTQLKGE